MKQEPIQYLGLDVHRSTVVASLRDEQGKVIMRATVATEAKAIVTLVKSAGSRVHVAFDEGTQAQWLHDLLINQQRAWSGRDEERERPHRRRRDVEAIARRISQAGVPRRAGDAHTQRAGEVLSQSGRGRDASDAAHRGDLSGTGDRHAGRVGLPKITAAEVVEEAQRRSASACELTAPTTGRPARAATESEGCNDRRGTSAARVEDPALGAVRVAYLLAIMRTPFRFRTKRNLWPYAGLAVVSSRVPTRSSRTGSCSEARGRR